MTTDSSSWNESMMNDWVAAQQKYWDTWRDFAAKASGFGGNGAAAPATNPFAAFSGFAQAPFAQGWFAQTPFAQAAAAQNPFAQSAMGQNPFGQNPFSGALDQWWSAFRPDAQGDLGSVAQRFYDMGKTYMSLAEGVFQTVGQEKPDSAMQLWMATMQAALQQWISQLQNNIDLATPDLPGVSGTTLTTWAQLADSVAPWLNMSQNALKEIAEGHLPGGFEMPGVGAAQEQFLRALSMPGLGYTREQQERLQGLARNLLDYHDALRAYKIAFGKTALASLESVQSRLQAMHAKGEAIDSLRALYDMWVDASEEAYAKFAMSDEYQVVYGDLVNTLMQVRKDMNEMAEQQYELMNLPTHSEIDTMQRRQQQLRRENRQLRHELQALRVSVDKLARERSAASSTPSSKTRSTRPKQDSLPIEDQEDDLTAIKGIGPKMMEKLYEQGIRNFARLAQLNTKLARELDETLNTQGRILRDDWIGQAKKLR